MTLALVFWKDLLTISSFVTANISTVSTTTKENVKKPNLFSRSNVVIQTFT